MRLPETTDLSQGRASDDADQREPGRGMTDRLGAQGAGSDVSPPRHRRLKQREGEGGAMRHTVLHTAQIIISFGLLGGVFAGTLLGWLDRSEEVRVIGFALGAFFAGGYKLRAHLTHS